jgi:uncharacterized protein (DUF305 family)
MTPSHIRAIVATLALAVAGCSGSPGGAVQTSPAPQPATTSTASPAAIAKARADSARLPYTAADIHFMSGMIGHHAQAIAMSNWAPTHGASGSIQTLAARIINAQRDDIALMQRWLRERLQPVPDATVMGMKMSMGGAEHVMLMPGMLTQVQMKQLDQARGAEFDKLFLSFMIQHHRGAVSMVSDLFGTYGAGQDETVFKFASDVNVDQSTEIERMQKMLATLTLGISVP